MNVFVTEAAYADLAHIGREIKKDSPARAVSFVDEPYDHCQRLDFMPRAFLLLPDWEDRGVRRRQYRDYLISTASEADKVIILHILHVA